LIVYIVVSISHSFEIFKTYQASLTLLVPTSCMPDMTTSSLAAAVLPRIGKIIKNGLRVFERGENLLQNGMHFANLQKSCYKVRIYTSYF